MQNDGWGNGGVSILQHEFQQKLILHVCTYFSTCYVQKVEGGALACNKKLLFGKVVFIRDMVHPSLFQSSLPPTFHASFIQSFLSPSNQSIRAKMDYFVLSMSSFCMCYGRASCRKNSTRGPGVPLIFGLDRPLIL